jgi:hypothetical protein
MAEKMSQEKEIAQSPSRAHESGKGTEIYSADRSTRWRTRELCSDSEPLEESILMPAPDSVEDSYRSEDESGVSGDEYVSEFQPADASERVSELES